MLTPADDTGAIGCAVDALFRLHASRRVHARQSAAAGVVVSKPGFTLLRHLQEHGPMPIGDLARGTDMDAAAAGRQVRQLERDGLVTRDASADDGRVTMVQVTPAGAEVRRRVAAVLERHLDDVLDRWPPDDRAELARLLTRFVDDLRSVHYRTVVTEQAG